MENNLNNLPPFYVGQKVVYITGNNMPKNSIHIILGIIRMPCGCWVLDIGKKRSSFKRLTCMLHDYSKKVMDSDVNYFNSTSFRPLLESPFPSLTFKEVIKKERELISMN